MSETTHTPGPWSVQKGIDCLHVVSDDNTFHTGCITFNGSAVAHANARLIAAAPDLRAAAEAVIAACERERPDIVGRDDEYIYDELGSAMSGAYVAARSAIEKARGESA